MIGPSDTARPPRTVIQARPSADEFGELLGDKALLKLSPDTVEISVEKIQHGSDHPFAKIVRDQTLGLSSNEPTAIDHIGGGAAKDRPRHDQL